MFLIRNATNDKIFLAGGINLPGIMNSHRFQLQNGGHRNPDLQKDWNELGATNFAFEIVDQLDPANNPQLDLRQELLAMEDLWLEKLKPFGERGYNQPKLSTAEKLRRIASKRNEDRETLS